MSTTAFKQLKDNAISTTSTSLASAGVTSIAAAANEGAKFPVPGTGFYLTIWNGSDPSLDPNMEKVLVTARATDTLTISATVNTHTSPANIALLDVSQNFLDIQQAINALESGANYSVASSSAFGSVQMSGDFGGTGSSPQVVATHLASALPIAQGGTGSTTKPFVDISTTQAAIAGDKNFVGSLTITNVLSAGFVVGPTGNPVFAVDNSAPSSATGVVIRGGAPGTNTTYPTITATSTATNEDIALEAKGTGHVRIGNVSTGVIYMNTNMIMTVGQQTFAFTVGRVGTANPAFNVNTNAGASVTGLNLSSFTAGNGIQVSSTSTAANESLLFNSKGTAQLVLNGPGSSGGGQVNLASGTILKRTAVADAAYTATVNDTFVGYSTLTAARTVTLPTAVGAAGEIYIVKDEVGAAGTSNLTVNTTSSQTIDGATTKVINTAYGVLRVYSDGANWKTW